MAIPLFLLIGGAKALQAAWAAGGIAPLIVFALLALLCMPLLR